MLIESSTGYGRGILRGVARYAKERDDWELTVQPRGMGEAVSSLRSNLWDGVISRLSEQRAAEAVQRWTCPVIELLYNEQIPVFGDDEAIIRLAFGHFTGLGFDRVHFFSFGGCSWVRQRRESFLRESARCGMTGEIFDPVPGRRDKRPEPLWRNSYEEPLSRWLDSLAKPAAILAANDHQALWLLNVCRRQGIEVPAKCAICGVNNDEHLCEIVTPTLTSIDPNAERIGEETARLLDLRISGGSVTGYPKRIPPRGLAEHKSTDALLVEDEDLAAAYRFIREQALNGIRVADVLAACNVTSKTLERWFKKRFGHTPEQEIIRIRLRKGSELLKTTNLSLRMVAEQSGFSSERYFSQAFRTQTGLSPKEYRQRGDR